MQGLPRGLFKAAVTSERLTPLEALGLDSTRGDLTALWGATSAIGSTFVGEQRTGVNMQMSQPIELFFVLQSGGPKRPCNGEDC